MTTDLTFLKAHYFPIFTCIYDFLLPMLNYT